MGRLLGLIVAVAVLALGGGPARAASPFGNWAAIFVAADNHAHSGAPSEVFDNARRDLATAFVRAGFSPGNVEQFSTHPSDYPGQKLMLSMPDVIGGELDRLATQARGGCLVYLTSHGAPDGIIVLTSSYFTSAGLAQVVDEACGDRPTVIVVSACFSGAFIAPLSRPNRMVMTAARPDRTSFGCGESDKYTFFDTCMLQQLPQAHDFPALGRAVQACVAKRESDMGLSPPSEPQVWIGPALAPDLPLLAFAAPP